jgi:hydroxymethylpyrimidine pyrophosphatase-like HAD family hydrolase
VAWVNCDLAHVSKGTGIARFREVTGLAQGRLAGIGDTMSDLAIREQVAYFAVPANAQDELKACADYVSPHHGIEGVLDILEHPAMRG